jgi:hypothetical protein
VLESWLVRLRQVGDRRAGIVVRLIVALEGRLGG